MLPHTGEWRRSVRRTLLIWLSACLCACALQPPPIATDLPPARLLDQVPFVSQDNHACGPASLAMVLQHYGVRETQARLKPLLLLPERKGTLQIELTAAARREGFAALKGPDDLNGLMRDVAAGYPVIVLQNLRFDRWPLWHYAVVIGFDQKDKVVLLRSGTNALIEETYPTFLTTWNRSGYWSLLVVPPGQIPPSTTPAISTDAAEALLQSHQPAAGLATYAASVHQWPDSITLWNGFGNAAYAQQRWTISVQAFAQSLLRSPSQARLWNNFAYALQQAGCSSSADQALHCAQQLAPQDALLMDSRRELDEIDHPATDVCNIGIKNCAIDASTTTSPTLKFQ